MIAVEGYEGRTVALFGLGGSGLATAQALVAGGARVIAWDDKETARDKGRAAGLEVSELHEVDWRQLDALILAPGVPLTHPKPHWTVELATRAHVPILGDIELFAAERRTRSPKSPFVAITGTNGKSTTTALVAHLLAAAGRPVEMGGNIGRPVLSLARFSPERAYVVECSSFQIDLARSLDPSIGVLTNLSPDHIDRHGSFEAYAAIKERMVEAAGLAVVGVDDPTSAKIADLIEGEGHRVVRISAAHRLDRGVHAEAGVIFEAGPDGDRAIADLSGIGSLRGRHNAQNAAAAVACGLALGLSADDIARGLATFPGLAHRMEEVGRIGRVLFVNDSKATNADSTAQALATFDRIHWIVGGRQKAGGITSLDGFFGRIARAYLIGECADDFAKTLDGRVDHVHAGTMARALELATAAAEADEAPEPVVLLSPACASYDQFASFEDRGDRFRAMVAALPGIVTRAGGAA
jgi:UDP-N-acetylmuramoylalanine--D-glutamate ligase